MKKIMRPEFSQEQKNENSYLDQGLQGLAKRIGRMVVIANYVSGNNDIIATKDKFGEFQVAREVKNADDWQRFQELTAQTDAIITGAGYLNRVKKLGKDAAEDVLSQFNPKGGFAHLGEWRLKHGLHRNPDIIVVSRSLDFDIPQGATADGRKVIIFTTHEMAGLNPLRYQKQGVTLVGAGQDGVDGNIMAEYLSKEMNYKVVKLTTGPRVLKILLDAKILDRLYISHVDTEIKFDNPKDVQKILVDGSKVADLKNFMLTQDLFQEHVITIAGIETSQHFLIYDNLRFMAEQSRKRILKQ